MSDNPDYATSLLLKERQKIQEELKTLDNNFCSVPPYTDWVRDKQLMGVEEYERKLKELFSKRDSIDHILTMISIRASFS